MNLTMTTTKKKTALATARSLDSFLMFKEKEFIKLIKERYNVKLLEETL